MHVGVWRERLPRGSALGLGSLVQYCVWRRESGRDTGTGRLREGVARKLRLQAASETRPSSMPILNRTFESRKQCKCSCCELKVVSTKKGKKAMDEYGMAFGAGREESTRRALQPHAPRGSPVKRRRTSRTIVIRLCLHALPPSSEYMLRFDLERATMRAHHPRA